MSYLVVVGNPLDGLTFHGPFEEIEDAWDWVEDEDEMEFWVAELSPPTYRYAQLTRPPDRARRRRVETVQVVDGLL